MPRLPGLDLLRALAATAVLLSHVAFWTGAANLDVVGGMLARGDVGVAIFFALSAFLLLAPWYRRALSEAPRPDVRRYARHRLARIVPAYLFALLAVLIVAVTLPGAGGLGSAAKVVAHMLLVQGYTGEHYQAFSQTWSLTTEATFYVLVPLLGSAICSGTGREGGRLEVARHLRRLGATALLGLLAQGLAATWTQTATPGAGVLASSVLGHAAWFAAGAAVALAHEAVRAGHRLPPVLDRIGLWWGRDPAMAAITAGVLFLIAATPVAGPRDLSPPGILAAVLKEGLYAAIAGLALTAAVGASGASWARRPVVSWLGQISYGIFLWHLLAIQVCFLSTSRPLFSGGFWWVLLPVLSLSVAAASVSYLLVEHPVLQATRRRDRPARIPTAPG